MEKVDIHMYVHVECRIWNIVYVEKLAFTFPGVSFKNALECTRKRKVEDICAEGRTSVNKCPRTGNEEHGEREGRIELVFTVAVTVAVTVTMTMTITMNMKTNNSMELCLMVVK